MGERDGIARSAHHPMVRNVSDMGNMGLVITSSWIWCLPHVSARREEGRTDGEGKKGSETSQQLELHSTAQVSQLHLAKSDLSVMESAKFPLNCITNF